MKEIFIEIFFDFTQSLNEIMPFLVSYDAIFITVG